MPETPVLDAALAADMERAAALLRGGGLVAFPTETVYGLGAVVGSPESLARIFEAKGRPREDPLILHVDHPAAVLPLVAEWPEAAERLAVAFWPGPLTLVLPRSERVPDIVTAGLPTVAVRCPAHPVARALLAAVGEPVAAPSANRFQHISPTTAAHVVHDLDGRIDAVLDGGPATLGIESTVVRLVEGSAVILRPGGITREEIEQALGPGSAGILPADSVAAPGSAGILPAVSVAAPGSAGVPPARATPMPAPGQYPRHYAPDAEIRLLPPDADLAALLNEPGLRDVGVLAYDEDIPSLAATGAHVESLGPRGRTEVHAARLYAALRRLEEARARLILVREFPASGLGTALNDRILRAAGEQEPADGPLREDRPEGWSPIDAGAGPTAFRHH